MFSLPLCWIEGACCGSLKDTFFGQCNVLLLSTVHTVSVDVITSNTLQLHHCFASNFTTGTGIYSYNFWRVGNIIVNKFWY
jgi:hypothetical protein